MIDLDDLASITNTADTSVYADGIAQGQQLQEYSAMQPHFQKAHSLLTNIPGERVQMLARLGYAAMISPAPRWGLATRLRSS